MARLNRSPYPWPWRDRREVGRKSGQHLSSAELLAIWEEERTEVARLLKISDGLPDGVLKGTLLSWSRGDGLAFYVVTSEKPLTLSWVPFVDCWQIEEALVRGLRKEDVLEMRKRGRAMRRLFSSRDIKSITIKK